MRHRIRPILRELCLLLLSACGGSQSTESPAPAPYALHEWGLLSVRAGSIELAAGPGRQPPPAPSFDDIAVEKPVIYIHNEQPTEFQLNVQLGRGYEAAEQWPGNALAWSVRSSGTACSSATPYPRDCQSVDGYCETRELSFYETSDAACLRVGDVDTSLLFYRLRAAPDMARTLPVSAVGTQVRAPQPRTGWRIRYDPSTGHRVARVEIGTDATTLPGAAAPSIEAASWVHDELERRGLSNPERVAFERAWWHTLFGLGEAPSAEGIERSVAEETPSEDMMEEYFPEEPEPAFRGPRDSLIYFLEPSEIDAIARIQASPAPTAIHRAFLVRVEIQP